MLWNASVGLLQNGTVQLWPNIVVEERHYPAPARFPPTERATAVLVGCCVHVFGGVPVFRAWAW